MEKSRVIRITPDVMKELGDQAEPFESPNDCIRRILKNNPLEEDLQTPHFDMDVCGNVKEATENA